MPAIRKSCVSGDIIPMLCGSAFKNKGVQSLLDYIIEFLPSPVDVGEVYGIDIDDKDANLKDSKAVGSSSLRNGLRTYFSAGRISSSVPIPNLNRGNSFVCNEYITLSNPRWEPSPPFGLIRREPRGKSTSSKIIKISFVIRFHELEISRTTLPLLFIPAIGLKSKNLSEFDAIT